MPHPWRDLLYVSTRDSESLSHALSSAPLRTFCCCCPRSEALLCFPAQALIPSGTAFLSRTLQPQVFPTSATLLQSLLSRARPAGPSEVRPGSGGEAPQRGDQVVVSYTARVVDDVTGVPGRIYDGSKNFQFTLGEGEARAEPNVPSPLWKSDCVVCKCKPCKSCWGGADARALCRIDEHAPDSAKSFQARA